MIKIGIVGFGNMGRMHYRCLRKMKEVDITAVCEKNPNIVEDSKKAVGNIEGATDQVDFSGFKLYTDLEVMLKEAGLDAVIITLPTFLHADFSIKSLEAGVHVLCEKPMALTIDDCERMITARKKSGKTLMIGHCIRFWPEYVKAKEIIDSGEYGKVCMATFRRISFPPAWDPDSWFLDENKSGGMALDLHIHDTDFVQYLFGVPKAVSSYSAEFPWGGLGGISTSYIYDDEIVVSAEGGWLMMSSFGFEMSFNIMLERATLVYDCTREPVFRLCPKEGDVSSPEVEPGDGYSSEIRHFVDIVGGKKVPEVITPEQSRDSIKIIEAERESAAKGEKIIIS